MPVTQNRPVRLLPGDRLAIVAPAGHFRRDGWEAACAFVCSLGFSPVWRDDVFDSLDYLAGSDQRRAAELNRAFADPQIKAIMAVRGGYGVTRLLESLDFELIKHNPKIFMGFSDNSALLLALQARCGLVGIHGPHFLKLPETQKNILDKYFRLLSDPTSPKALFEEKLQVLRAGRTEGKLICSNLSLLCSLLGTPYLPDLKDCILIIEDVNEEAYRIDRMLTQLRLAGILAGLAGLALGAFTVNSDQEAHNGLVFRRAVEITADYGYPLLAGLPVGHIPQNHAVPCGVMACIDGDGGCIEILEALVT